MRTAYHDRGAKENKLALKKYQINRLFGYSLGGSLLMNDIATRSFPASTLRPALARLMTGLRRLGGLPRDTETASGRAGERPEIFVDALATLPLF